MPAPTARLRQPGDIVAHVELHCGAVGFPRAAVRVKKISSVFSFVQASCVRCFAPAYFVA